MGAAFFIMLREGIEAALIVAILLGYLHKIGQSRQARYVWLGTGGAVGVSVLLAIVLWYLVGEFEGRAEQVFEGTVMLIAVAVVTSMILWMQRQAHSYAQRLGEQVGQVLSRTQPPGTLERVRAKNASRGEEAFPASSDDAGKTKFTRGQLLALAGVAFTAVLREGVESVLLLAAWSVLQPDAKAVVGAVLGAAAAIVLAYLLFRATLRLALRRFFLVTGLFLIVVAAGLLAGAVHELQEARLLPVVVEHVWDASAVLNDQSPGGMLLRALVGYNANPSLLEVLAWGAYVLVVGGRFLGFGKTPLARPTPTQPPTTPTPTL
ncbi:MAG: FTR1 family protein [Limnochordaceae bacterium]|nr:FTR1 family protein [Limnochordaceae bacterium]